jgi:type IV pilus assembly protein PilM
MLRRFAEVPLPRGAATNGEILDEGAVIEAVSSLWSQAKLPKKRIVIGTANPRVVVRQVDVPQMEEEELAEALPFQVQDSIPIAVDEAVLDFVPLEEFTTPDGEPMLSILAIAAPREIIDTLTAVTDGAGLGLLAVDLQSFALVRAIVGHGAPAESGATGIVDIGGSVSQVVVAKNGKAQFARLLPRGGDDFTGVLADGLDIDDDEAETMKRRIGVAPDVAPPGDDADALALRLLTRQADSLIEELRGSINYYLSQAPEDVISRLVVAGNAARLPHLANRIGSKLGFPVEPARTLGSLEVGRVQMSQEELMAVQPVLPTAVGLALWGAG